jgi:hypothetical protein
MPASPAELSQIGSAGANSGVREVRKDSIDTETEELEIFQARIAAIVGNQLSSLWWCECLATWPDGR